MTRKSAINTAKAQGYGIRYSKNPKEYEIWYSYSDGTDNLEWTGNTIEEAFDKLEEIGYEIAEMLMNI